MFIDSADYVWHVAKDGNDGNGGHAQQYPVDTSADAKLTIAAAIAAAAAGDTIIIWPGTYTENVDVNKTLKVYGTHCERCRIESASNHALQITADYCHIENIYAKSTASGTYYGIRNTGHNLYIANCYGEGDYDGIHLGTSVNYVYADRCYGKGKFDGIQLGSGKCKTLINSIGETDGTNTINASVNGIVASTCTASIIRNCKAYAVRDLDGDTKHLAGFVIEGDVILENCIAYVSHTGQGARRAVGLYIKGSSAQCLAKGVYTYVSSEYGYAIGLYQDGGNCLTIGSLYNAPDSGYVSNIVDAQVGGSEKSAFVETFLPIAMQVDDKWNGNWVQFTSGNNNGEIKVVDDWQTGPNEFHFATDFTNDIEIGDNYDLITSLEYDIYVDDGTLNVVDTAYDTARTLGSFTLGGSGWAAAVNTEADTALSDIKLDHLISAAESGDVTANSVVDKMIGTAGACKLASDGLDSISTTEPAGVASNFREMMVQVWRRFFKKATATKSQVKTYVDAGTVGTTQTVTFDGTTKTINNAS